MMGCMKDGEGKGDGWMEVIANFFRMCWCMYQDRSGVGLKVFEQGEWKVMNKMAGDPSKVSYSHATKPTISFQFKIPPQKNIISNISFIHSQSSPIIKLHNYFANSTNLGKTGVPNPVTGSHPFLAANPST